MKLLTAGEVARLLRVRIDAEQFQEAWGLRLKFDDQPGISFTDLSSFVVMRKRGIATVLTQDRHFRMAGFQPVP